MNNVAMNVEDGRCGNCLVERMLNFCAVLNFMLLGTESTTNWLPPRHRLKVK